MPDACPVSDQMMSDEPAPPLQTGRASWRLWLAVLAAGVTGGLAGISLVGLLRFVQHLAYGYGGGHLISPVSFLQGVTAASPLRRWLVMVCCGVVAGAGWWALRRFGRPLVGISRTLTEGGAELPAGSTLIHALLQVVTVALGSPLGREVAPREVAAVATQAVADRLGLAADERRIVVACAAGAGLAAVYNVPLGGALFVLESLLLSFSWRGRYVPWHPRRSRRPWRKWCWVMAGNITSRPGQAPMACCGGACSSAPCWDSLRRNSTG